MYTVTGRYARDFHFVKVETDEGIYGFGEATLCAGAPAVRECISLLKHHLIGLPIYNIEDWFNRCYTCGAFRDGVIMNTAISGVEMAIWDAIGKKIGLPVYALIGGKVRNKVKLCQRGLPDAEEQSAAGYAAAARRAVERGFSAIKFDPVEKHGKAGKSLFQGEVHPTVTRKDLQECIDTTATIREAVGPYIDIYLEFRGMLTFDQSLWLARQLEPYNLGFIEEPLQQDNWDGYRKLALKSNIPIAVGARLFTRWGHRRLIEEGVLSVIQPDVSHSGGILETKKISAIAEAYYLRVAPHNSGGPSATMAAVHVDATNPNFLCQEISLVNFETDRIYKRGLNYEDGYILLDDNVPGLGLEPDFEALENSRTYTQNMRDW